MHATIRRYEGVDQNRTDELTTKVNESLAPKLSKLPGFAGYYLIETGNGIMSSLSLFENVEQAEESTRVAATWVRDEKLETRVPELAEGHERQGARAQQRRARRRLEIRVAARGMLGEGPFADPLPLIPTPASPHASGGSTGLSGLSDEGKRVNDEHERDDVPAGRGRPDPEGSDGQGRRQADTAGKVRLLALEHGEAPASAGLGNGRFGSLSLSDSEVSRLRDWEVIDRLVEAGCSRLSAERKVEIERGNAKPGRARLHGVARR